MTRTARTAAQLLLPACMLVLAGCTVAAARTPLPPPHRPAGNPYQAGVRARAYTVALTAAALPGTAARDASATAAISIAAARDEVCWSITALSHVPSPLFAYIHRGTRGSSGPVVVPLGSQYRPSGCVTGIAPALLTRIEARPGAYYLAIHNRAEPLGAVRGQL